MVLGSSPKSAEEESMSHLQIGISDSKILLPTASSRELSDCYNTTKNRSLDISTPKKTNSRDGIPCSNSKTTDDQNNLDNLWTWTVNGSKIEGSLSFLTGAVELVQNVLAYWRGEVLTWWSKFQRRISRWSSGIESIDKNEEENTEQEFEDTTEDEI